jgi:hypothetical protein
LRECGDSSNDSSDHEAKGNNRPNNTPALRRTPIFLSKDAGVRGVDFSKDEIVALSTVSLTLEVAEEILTISQTL